MDTTYTTKDTLILWGLTIHTLLKQYKVSPNELGKALMKTDSFKYITEGYDVFHTQGVEYLSVLVSERLSEVGFNPAASQTPYITDIIRGFQHGIVPYILFTQYDVGDLTIEQVFYSYFNSTICDQLTALCSYQYKKGYVAELVAEYLGFELK
jgi:hypothetical protein